MEILQFVTHVYIVIMSFSYRLTTGIFIFANISKIITNTNCD